MKTERPTSREPAELAVDDCGDEAAENLRVKRRVAFGELVPHLIRAHRERTIVIYVGQKVSPELLS